MMVPVFYKELTWLKDLFLSGVKSNASERWYLVGLVVLHLLGNLTLSLWKKHIIVLSFPHRLGR